MLGFPKSTPGEYAEAYGFIERDLCDYYLFENDPPKLRDRLNFIAQHPVGGTDQAVIPLYYKLMYYGHYEELVKFSRKVIHPLSMSEELRSAPENLFFKGLYLNGLQQVYQDFKNTGVYGSEILKDLIEEYGMQVDTPGQEKEAQTLQNPVDPEDIHRRFLDEDKDSDCWTELKIHFLKYMYETYGVPFVLS